MADDPKEMEEAPRKGGLKALAVPLALGLAGGGGAFYAAYSGMLDTVVPGGDPVQAEAPADPPPDLSFVELDPLQIAVGGKGSIRQLRFRAYLQVGPGGAPAVEAVRPRVLDIFATYLRALPLSELQDPTALLHVRAQLLRRVQLLTGPDMVEDLLIIDFVIA
jgi:flagellar FliL protein